MEQIKRREALKRAAWIMGGTLSAPVLAGVLKGCTPKPELTWQPTFFDEKQARLVMQIAEGILPETDTPGAKALGVPGFIEEMVSKVFGPADRDEFMKGLADFDLACDQQMGDDFVSLNGEEQSDFLNQKNKEMQAGGDNTRFFRTIKQLTVVGYCTTEVGATQVLQYQPIPVNYNGCVPIGEAGNGKTWAT